MVNFSRIAPFYDLLVKIVFGNSMLKAKRYFIHKLPEYGSVLFIGGSSGMILKKIVTLKHELKIDFMQLSEKFISIVKKKLGGDLSKHVNFIHGDQNQIVRNK